MGAALAFDAANAIGAIDAACAEFVAGQRYRLRLGLAPDGKFNIASSVLSALAEPVKVFIAGDGTKATDVFLRP